MPAGDNLDTPWAQVGRRRGSCPTERPGLGRRAQSGWGGEPKCVVIPIGQHCLPTFRRWLTLMPGPNQRKVRRSVDGDRSSAPSRYDACFDNQNSCISVGNCRCVQRSAYPWFCASTESAFADTECRGRNDNHSAGSADDSQPSSTCGDRDSTCDDGDFTFCCRDSAGGGDSLA